ncbi:uncharacterized protein LOC133910450 [Phragmites australis]|uniref:uncharacterized protein LOC133910450 n=1 Tax=Phragmites australis TaxID=29695 RepID=UPI002D79849A|nr:uncharacterized protein LOC133910450 [Phragmites australis]
MVHQACRVESDFTTKCKDCKLDNILASPIVLLNKFRSHVVGLYVQSFGSHGKLDNGGTEEVDLRGKNSTLSMVKQFHEASSWLKAQVVKSNERISSGIQRLAVDCQVVYKIEWLQGTRDPGGFKLDNDEIGLRTTDWVELSTNWCVNQVFVYWDHDIYIDVPLEVVHLSDEYWNHVVSHIINEYRCGRTPNPDVLCNTRIKFGAFLEAIEKLGFDYIASGHYAHVIHPSVENTEAPSVLQLSKDKVKDQTYFLSHLSQSQLRRLIFPLGCITKDEVRRLAAQMGLPNQGRKDSQGMCFLGKVKFSEFVERHIREMEGVILEAESGDYLGKHRGFWFYTIGQRQGLRLPGGPWYVVEKDVQNNVVLVSRNYYSLDKRRRAFRVGSLNWFNNSGPANNEQLKCKVRHSPEFHGCTVTKEHTGENDVLVVHLSEDDQGLAAGQYAAFYCENSCLVSGIILDSWDEMSFPVCSRALEIAKLEDKLSLGKPVRTSLIGASTSRLFLFHCIEHDKRRLKKLSSQILCISIFIYKFINV